MGKSISIIISACNSEEHLRRCIDGLLAQSVRNLEIIIIDDGAKGKVKELYSALWQDEPRVRLISPHPNQGLFQAQITGFEHADGEWIAFVNADDSVSPDRFRLMIGEGRRQDADMVWGDCVLLNHKRKMRRFNSILEQRIQPIEKPELQRLFFLQSGSDFEWQTVWGRIYRRDLAERMLPLMKRQTGHLVMCEDVAVSVCAYVSARKMALVHGAPYYCNGTNDGVSRHVRSFSAIEKSLTSIQTAFSFSEMIVREYSPEFCSSVSFWKERVLAIWYDLINNDGWLRSKERQLLVERVQTLCAPLPVTELHTRLATDSTIEKKQPLAGPDLDDIRKVIAAPRVKIVSFNIFDTLVVRPFYWPSDLFVFLGNDFLKKFKMPHTFLFKEVRIQAEKMAREKHPQGEPGLDEIYWEFQLLTGFSDEQISFCKERECELELQYCRPRKSANDLFEYALASGKEVVATSDMYLPEDFLRKMLHNCGYHDFKGIFVSCARGGSKSKGTTYRMILDSYHLAPDEMVHIGDDYVTDVKVPRKIGIRAFYFRRPIDVFEEQFGKLFSPFGHQDSRLSMDFIGTRCMFAQIACRLYDNPSLNLMPKKTVFGGNLAVWGYAGLGMYLLALTQWIQEVVKTQHFSGLHFYYRDGYLPMVAYELLYGDSKEKVPYDMWYLNRDIAIVLSIQSKDDLLSLLTWRTSFPSVSLENLMRICQGVVPQAMIDSFIRHFSKRIPLKQKLTEEQLLFIVRFLRHVFGRIAPYFEEYSKNVSENLKKKLFGDNDASFDIGYSCRAEHVLKRRGIFLSPLFLHCIQDVAMERMNDMNEGRNARMFTFYDFFPLNTGVIRELCFSSIGPHCDGYRIDNGELVPFFSDKNDYHEDVQSIVQFAQYEALAFLKDWKMIFGDRLNELYYRYTDASRFFEQFLHLASPYDMDILQSIPFEDNLGNDTTDSLAALWRTHIDVHAAMERSITFQIVQILTWPWRMISKGLRCWREKGFSYAYRRGAVEIGKHLRRLK